MNLKGSLLKKGDKGLTKVSLTRRRSTQNVTGLKGWKKRYFELHSNRLYYYKTVEDSQPINKIPLAKANCIRLTPTPPQGLPVKKRKCAFEIDLESRVYYLCAESEDEAKMWVEGLNESKRLHVADHAYVCP